MHTPMVFLLAYLFLYFCMLPGLVAMLLAAMAAIIHFRFEPLLSREALLTNGGLTTPSCAGERRFVILVPAHNEEGNVAKTVRSCLAVDYPTDSFQVLVIADNCTDATASRANEAGARVVERIDATRKSKGHALEYVIECLERSGELDELDALVVVDADSTVSPNLLKEFSSGLDRGYEWMQCYDCVGNADETWRTRLMAYGISLYNGVALAGKQALGFSAALRGNGMCVSTAGLRRVPWKANSLVEDQEYSWIVRTLGGRIDFMKDAAVFATMLRAGGAPLADQRRRWEFGRIDVCRKMLVPLIRSRHVGWREKLAGVVEITSPPMGQIALGYAVMSAILVFTAPGLIAGGRYGVLSLIGVAHVAATLTLVLYGLSPFLASLLPWKFILSLGYVPYYIFWKLFVLAKGGPDRWIATFREEEPPSRFRCEHGRFADARHGTKADGC